MHVYAHLCVYRNELGKDPSKHSGQMQTAPGCNALGSWGPGRSVSLAYANVGLEASGRNLPLCMTRAGIK